MPSVLERLSRLRDRSRRVAIVSASAAGLSVLLGAGLVSATTDRLWHLEPAVLRLLLLLLAITGGVITGVMIWRRHPQSRSLTRWALDVQKRWPETCPRLAAAADFLENGPAIEDSSRELSEEVVRQATVEFDRLSDHQLQSLVDTATLRRSLGMLAALVLIGAGLFVMRPADARLAAARWGMPLSAPAWPQTTILRWLNEDLQPLDQDSLVRKVAADEPVTLSIDNERGPLPEEVRIHATSPDGTFVELPVRSTSLQDYTGRPHEVAVVTVVPVAGKSVLMASGGDDHRAPPLTLVASSPPMLEQFRIVVTPPRYTGRSLFEQSSSVAHVHGVTGSEVSIRATSSAPLSKCNVQFESGAIIPARLEQQGRDVAVSFPIERVGQDRFWFDAIDREGLNHPHPPRYDLIGETDTLPTVTLESPDQDLRLTPSARLRFRVSGRDDYGISAARLELKLVAPVEPGNQPVVHVRPLDIEPSGSKTKTWEGEWALGELGMKEGQRFELQAVLVDAKPATAAGDREGRSASRTIEIVPAGDVLRDLAAAERTLADELQPLVDAVARDLSQLRQTRAAWRSTHDMDRPSAESLRRQAAAAEASARRLSSDEGWVERVQRLSEAYALNGFQEDAAVSRLEDVQKLASRVGQAFQPEAAQAIREVVRSLETSNASKEDSDRIVPSPDDVPRIDDLLANAESSQRQAEQSLSAAAGQMQRRSQQLDVQESLSRIAANQHALREETMATGSAVLAKAAADVSPEERGSVAKLAERQRQIQESFDRIVAHQETPNEDDPSSANATDFPKISALMTQASTSLDEFNIGAALQSQEALDRMLGEGQLRPESNQDAIADAVREIDEADQLIKRMAEEEAEWIRSTEQLSAVPSADSMQRETLSQLQKQQEQAAEALSELASRLRQIAPQASPEISEASEELRRSAELLEDTSFAESLAHAKQGAEKLDDAGKALAAQKIQADFQKQLAAYDQARALAGGLAERQRRLQEETARLDGIIREQGQLKRSQRRTLLRLADDQTALAAETEAAATGAPDEVTAWAFTSIAARMSIVGERLQESNVSESVQQQQQNAVRQLEAIVGALAMEPPAPPQPDSPSESSENPENGSKSDSEDAAQLVWLAPQLELLKQLQLDLMERTKFAMDPAHADTTDQAALQMDQQKLAELAQTLLTDAFEDTATSEQSPDDALAPEENQ